MSWMILRKDWMKFNIFIINNDRNRFRFAIEWDRYVKKQLRDLLICTDNI